MWQAEYVRGRLAELYPQRNIEILGSLALAPTGAEFLGSDAAAGELTGGVPWLEPLFRPGSPELESGLFALQAGLGGILLGFVLGRLTARRRS